MDGKRLDELLAATDGHTPGPWEDVYAGSGDWEKLKEIGPLGLFGRSLAFSSRGDSCRPDHELIKAAPAFRAAVIALREENRRAQLLTVESVKAICEREGFRDKGSGYNDAFEFPLPGDGNGITCFPTAERRHWRIYRWVDCRELFADCLTTGQLEDAVRLAKQTKGETTNDQA